MNGGEAGKWRKRTAATVFAFLILAVRATFLPLVDTNVWCVRIVLKNSGDSSSAQNRRTPVRKRI